MDKSALMSAVRDKKVRLMALTSALALVLGFMVVPPLAAVTAVKYGGFWVVMTAFALFVWATARVVKGELAGWRPDRREWIALGGVAACGVLLLVHERYGFRIVMDELMLLGTSMSLHFDKTAITPMRAHDIQGTLIILGGYLDKRPLFFPFLVSLVHDLAGYRPENVFVLNTLLTFVFLLLAYVTGRMLAGRKTGILLVSLLTSLPLLAQNATGGGFELLNVVMILATLLLGALWFKRRDADSLTAFCLSGVLLAQTRYESALFIVPVACFVLWVWWTERRVILSWPVVFAPLLLLIYPLHYKIFSLRETAWQLFSKPEYTKVFSPAYLGENLAHAVNFFFDPTKLQSNSLLLSALGMIALPFLVLMLAKKMKALNRSRPIEASLVFFSGGLIAAFLLLMCYFWGKFDDPVIRRLSLPTNLLLALAVAAVIPQVLRTTKAWVTLFAAIGLAIMMNSLPAMAGHAYTEDYLPGREVEWRREFIRQHPEKDYLMIDNDSVLWITHQVSSTPILQAQLHKQALVFHRRNHTWTEMYVFQRLNIDPDTGKVSYRTDDDLGPDFVLETVVERRLKLSTISRISRIVEIKGETARATLPAPAVPTNEEEREKIRQRYLENWIKQLP